MTPSAISTLRDGDEVAGVFACTRKDRLLARSGTPYLAVELRDRTGALPGRVFRDADLHAGRFDRGDLVRVAGRVERFREALQVDLRAIVRADPAETDPTAFLPVAYRDLDELDGFLEHLAGEVRDPGLRSLLDTVVHDDALRAELRRRPCTRNGHHAYLGGLLEHTVAVATLAVETCALHPRLDQELLVTAAVVHDLGRIRELRLGAAEIELTDEGRLLGHVELGLRMLDERARACGLDEARASRARPLRPHPPRRRRGAGPAIRLGRGAGPAPHQRARRRDQGRPRARTGSLNARGAGVGGHRRLRRGPAAPGGRCATGRPGSSRSSIGPAAAKNGGVQMLRVPAFSTNGGEDAPGGFRTTVRFQRRAPSGQDRCAVPLSWASASSTARRSELRVKGFWTKAMSP